ncbi:adenylyl-sulfate kinase [Nonomuraea sp. ZG12]|uniref:adenylyl-sulfate kinase n=1 Tax=Nonomuraea sp. ZG12 TaxID=3452207 RepID=UPI003F8986B7
MITSEPPRALLITGTVGSGKTATADALGGLLADAGIPNAVVDLDWLRRSWPSPPGDPFNTAMTLRNLRDVARNYLEAGVSRLVLAGVVESRAERRRYEETLAAELTVCRLRVALPAVHRRLTRRHEGDEAGLRWHVERSGELDRILDAASVEDVVVEAADRPAVAVAAAVLDAVGWR